MNERDASRLVDDFEHRRLPKPQWTHEAHLVVCRATLRRLGPADALDHLRGAIRAYNDSTGVANTDTGGYHETLTLFWLRAVRAFLDTERNEARALVHLANELAVTHDKGLPFSYYTRERLFSPEARAGWVEPDLKPLD